MSNANSSISAILVESDGSITLAGSGGMVFLNADGTLNTGRGDGDGSGGRTGHVLNSNIGFVTGLTDAGTYYFDAGSPDYWSEYPSDGSGFIITSMGDSSHSYLTSVDFNGQFNAGFGGDADTGYGAIVVGADPYTWSAANLHRPTVVATPWETDDNLIVTAAFDAVSGTWGLNQYDLDGYYQHTFDTGLTSMEALLQRSDGTLVAVGYDAEGQGQLLTISLTGTGGSETVPYYCTLASETALPGESDGGVFLSQIVLDASGQVINAGGYDNTIWGFNPTATATRVWVQQDANWNVTSIEDSSGNVLERYDYTPYGQRTVLDASGAEKAGGSDYNWVYNFQGMRYDSLSKTNEAQNRFETLDGRWLTKDPSQNIYIDGMNPYQGFGSNPINRRDPTGLATVKSFNVKKTPDGSPNIDGTVVFDGIPYTGLDVRWPFSVDAEFEGADASDLEYRQYVKGHMRVNGNEAFEHTKGINDKDFIEDNRDGVPFGHRDQVIAPKAAQDANDFYNLPSAPPFPGGAVRKSGTIYHMEDAPGFHKDPSWWERVRGVDVDIDMAFRVEIINVKTKEVLKNETIRMVYKKKITFGVTCREVDFGVGP